METVCKDKKKEVNKKKKPFILWEERDFFFFFPSQNQLCIGGHFSFSA